MENQLILGDCFEVLGQFPDNSFNAIITDPPYQYLDHKLDTVFNEQELIDMAWRLINKGLFVVFGRGESYFKLNYLLTQKGFKFKEEIIWDKNYTSSPVLPLGRVHENISLLSKNKACINRIKIDRIENLKTYDTYKLESDIKRIMSTIRRIKTLEELEEFKEFRYGVKDIAVKNTLTARHGLKEIDRGNKAYKSYSEGMLQPSIMRLPPDRYKYLHPTEKPLELIKRLVLMTTKEGNLVLDPFGGSGTTAIACLETGRRYVVIEKDKEYYDIAFKRISDWHNNRLDSTGIYQLPEGIERINIDNSGQLSLF